MRVSRDEKSSEEREGKEKKKERFVFIIKNRFQKENSVSLHSMRVFPSILREP